MKELHKLQERKTTMIFIHVLNRVSKASESRERYTICRGEMTVSCMELNNTPRLAQKAAWCSMDIRYDARMAAGVFYRYLAF